MQRRAPSAAQKKLKRPDVIIRVHFGIRKLLRNILFQFEPKPFFFFFFLIHNLNFGSILHRGLLSILWKSVIECKEKLGAF